MGEGKKQMMNQVMDALTNIRAPLSVSEYDLHALVAEALQNAGLEFLHEAPLLPRCRIDFLCGQTGIELKRGRPNASSLRKQLERYLKSDRLTGIVVVSERAAALPDRLLGKPVLQLSLQKLWGIALCADETVESENAVPDGENTCAVVPEYLSEAAPQPVEKNSDASDEVNSEPLFDETLEASGALSGGADADAEDEGLHDFLFSDEKELQKIPLPAYLTDSDALPTHYYGTLSYNRRSKCWTIKGEPCVTELCKRLFPGSAGAKRGEARFTAHRRAIGDIGWLMLRYPLAVSPQDEKRWKDALDEARTDYRRRELARVAPPQMDPPASAFLGTLRDFQKTGLSFLLMTPRALLADEMGLGKTVQALAALATVRAYPVLLVVPPHLVRNWQAEIDRFLRVSGRMPRVHVLKGLKPYPLPAANIYIVHYLLLRGWKEALGQYDFRSVIFDEIQELRRAGTEKYSAASLLSEKSSRVWGLSGTPIYNQGGEIWNIVNILDFHFLGDFESFSREWCAGYGNNIVLKPDLLGEHLRREGLMLRRTKQEVLPELPEKRRLVQEIDADDALYRNLMAPVFSKLRRWKNDDKMTASERALLEDQISQEERQATGLAKAPYVCQFVRALTEDGEKVLLFAHHHAVMDYYKKELKSARPVFITGRETGAQKEDAVERFMTGKTDLCCISLRAASGLNLQRATCVVFGELDWSPAVHSQAEDRAHRIGQKDSLLCYYLVSPRGSDRDIQEALGLKVSQFLSLMGDKPETEEQRLMDASIARRHVEKLAMRLGTEREDITAF